MSDSLQMMMWEDNFNVDSHFGDINYTEAKIRINRDMPEDLQMVTLVHEWLHGALVMIGFNEEAQNEQFVQALSVAINQTFKIRE